LLLAHLWTACWLTAVASALGGQPTTSTSAPADRAVTAKVPLAINGRDTSAAYWLRLPPGYEAGQKPALLICLHGTDDTANDMIAFWGRLRTPYPVMIAAPQGVAPGWRSDDLPTIRAMFAHLREQMSYDANRVLLAGFSAGGAMTFRLLYKEAAPVTAAAALANYVPVSISPEEVKQRRSVPVFYAVGMADVNHERMHFGIRRLRDAGGNVTLYRPEIGHVLDPVVGQAALGWFFEEMRNALGQRIKAAAQDPNVAGAVLMLEEIAAQARWHENTHAESARQMLEQLEAPGREQLDRCRKLIATGRKADAVEELLKIETQYGAGRLGWEARHIRLKLETEPEVRQELAERTAKRREAEALDLYQSAQKLAGRRQFQEAAERCRQILTMYKDTASAERAQFLLTTLEKRISP
jgi:poly(3-hydroxybutyrate) depolymerase